MSEVDGRGVGEALCICGCREFSETGTADGYCDNCHHGYWHHRGLDHALEAADELYEAAEAFVENSGFAFAGAERYTYNAFELHKAHLRLKPALDRYRQAREKEGR